MSSTIGKWSRRRKSAIVLLVILAVGLGYVAGRSGSDHAARPPTAAAKTESETAKPKWWTCSMHPQIHRPKPGRCPICGMELIPLKGDSADDAGMRQFTTSEASRKLMDIQTSRVMRRFVTANINMVGRVDYDETRVGYITAWVPGRLDRLYVDYTGIPVKKGDHMVYLYSPELLSAQEELLQAKKAVGNLERSSIALIRESAQATVEAAREKLRLWGLTQAQVAEIEKRGTASDHMTIYAPMGGIVIHKNAQEGMYVKTGARIYTIADLNHVWVRLDAYESDLMWLRYGQEVEFTMESYPGEVFKGQISFIDPFLNPKTRTVKVRVNVPNRHGKLKPGMFVRATVRADVASGGQVMDPALAGKWMCPMHPEVIKDEAGKCDICHMPLVRTESLGYVAARESESAKPLVIPAGAPLVTGRRAVVYVQLPDRKRPTFEGREIVLGPRAGDYYIVRHGLNEGELVVTQGNFKIDSALQISAKPSMMTPEGGGGGGHHHGGEKKPSGDAGKTMPKAAAPDEFLRQMKPLTAAHDEVVKSVRTGDVEQTKAAFKAFGQALDALDASSLSGHPAMVWKEMAMLLKNDSIIGAEAKDAQDLSRTFPEFERHWERLNAQFPTSRAAHGTHAAQKRAEVPGEFQKQIGTVVDHYLSLQVALAQDNDEQAGTTAAQLQKALGKVDMKLLDGEAHMLWMKHLKSLQSVIDQLLKANDIKVRREAFALLSEALAQTVPAFGVDAKPLFQLRCSMAFNNRGATWLQSDKDVRNPYFGQQMLKCGEVVRLISTGKKQHSGDRRHE